MYILLGGMSHKTAPVELREKMAFSGSGLQEAYLELTGKPSLEGVVILSTCNRTEIYATTRDIERGAHELNEYIAERLQLSSQDMGTAVYSPTCYDAISHLFRVASGLDSMVLGETQILGQVKDAYLSAIQNDASDSILNTLFQKALYVGKKVRTDTGLDRHAMSISYAAVEMAKKVFGDLNSRTVMIIGAGKMSELTVKYLVASGVSTVFVSNRSYERACGLADKVEGQAIMFDDLFDYLMRTDIIISCTAASHYVLHKETVLPHVMGRETPLLLIDIAVPRDIDPEIGSIPGMHLYDIDDLENVIEVNVSERKKAAFKAEKIIAEELLEFNDWMSTLFVIPVVKALKQRGEDIKEAELERAMNRLGAVSAREEKIIRSLASSIVNQMMHFPVVNLKEMAVTNQGHLYAELTKKLFELQIEVEENQAYAVSEGRVQGK
ncbi:MAG: glutamyl-tRNA reductase [Acidobacteriota bacterium]